MLRSDLLLAGGEGMIDADARSFTVPELEARLRPFVKRRVSGSDVDDVLQEILLRVQRGLTSLRDEERFGPWVYRIARSAVADNGRARARSLLVAAPMAEVSSDPAVEDDGAAEMLAGAVAPFVARLPSPYREAVTMTELEGMPQREAAAALGISVTAMKSRVRRGRARLRALLEACCEIASTPVAMSSPVDRAIAWSVVAPKCSVARHSPVMRCVE